MENVQGPEHSIGVVVCPGLSGSWFWYQEGALDSSIFPSRTKGRARHPAGLQLWAVATPLDGGGVGGFP